jgi:hypothetical protein
LKHNVLTIGTTATETQFLGESELPSHARPGYVDPDDDKLTSGATPVKRPAINGGAGALYEYSACFMIVGTVIHSPTTSSSSSHSNVSVDEAKVAELVQMGFAGAMARAELIKTNGNVQLAAVNLLSKSIQLPKKS